METAEIKPEIILQSLGEGGGTGMLRYNLGFGGDGKILYKFVNCSKDTLPISFEAITFLEAFALWENALKQFLKEDVMLDWFYCLSPSIVHDDYKVFIANDLRNRLIKYPNQKPRSLARWAKMLNVSVDFLLGNE